jgi:hypothetical protein
MSVISLRMVGSVPMSQFKKTKAFNIILYTLLKYKRKRKLIPSRTNPFAATINGGTLCSRI